MKIDLGFRFLKNWQAGQPPYPQKRGVFYVEDPDGGPRFWAYRRAGASKREIRDALKNAFGPFIKISGAYPNYIATRER